MRAAAFASATASFFVMPVTAAGQQAAKDGEMGLIGLEGQNEQVLCVSDGNLRRDLLGVHGTASGERELATDTRATIRREQSHVGWRAQGQPQGAMLVGRHIQMRL
jgi:hypothetical protein